MYTQIVLLPQSNEKLSLLVVHVFNLVIKILSHRYWVFFHTYYSRMFFLKEHQFIKGHDRFL